MVSRLHWLVLGCGLWLASCGGSPPATPTATIDPEVAHGQRLFSQHCASCHAVEPEVVIVGPSLANVATRAVNRVDELDAQGYLLQSIVRPQAYLVAGFDDAMPTDFGKHLTGEEVDALVAYLMTLR